MPSNRIALRDLALYGGEPVSTLEDRLLVRDPKVATSRTRRLYERSPLRISATSS